MAKTSAARALRTFPPYRFRKEREGCRGSGNPLLGSLRKILGDITA